MKDWRENNLIFSLNEKLNQTHRIMLSKMLDPMNVKNFIENAAELEQFLRLDMFREDKGLNKLRDKFTAQFREMVPGFLGVLDNCIKNDAIGEALKLLKHL